MKNILLPLFISILFSTLGCWDAPLLTELGTNRLEIRLKGTYASNTPRDWVNPESDMTSGEYQANVMDDSIDDLPFIVDTDFPDEFKLDIAEIRLVGENGKTDRIGGYRKTFRLDMTDSESFFSGDGILLKNDDPKPGKRYTKIKLYVRKMLFDKAKYYETKFEDSSGSKVYDYDAGWMTTADYAALTTPVENLIEGIFAENTEEGFDFNLLQISYRWDAFRKEEDSTNRIFPVEIPIEGGLIFDNKTDKTVLEIRFVIKNFIKKYEYDVMNYAPSYASNLQAPVIAHFYAMSDWLRDVRAGETDMGGNLHAVARSYVPGQAETITGTISGGTAPGYIIVVPESASLSDYYINLSSNRVTNTLRNLNVTDCEPPVLMTTPSNSTHAYMEYFLKYEEYRVDWDVFSTDCTVAASDDDEMETFATQWHAYDGTSDDSDNYTMADDLFELSADDGAARTFKIPPFAVYVDADGVYTVENVPAGSYDVYFVKFDNTEAEYGRLFDDIDSKSTAVPATVSTGIPATGIDFSF